MDNNSSGGFLSKPTKIYHEEQSGGKLLKPMNIYHNEPEPEIIEEVKPEPQIEVVKEVEKPELPEKKVNISQIRFNPPTKFKPYEPKKLSLLKIAWMGFTRQEMDASDQRKFDNIIIDGGRPLLLCVVIAIFAFYAATQSNIGSEKYSGKSRTNDWFNRMINYFVDKYDGNNKVEYKDNFKNTVVLDTTKIDSTPIKETPKPIDTLIDVTRDATRGFENDTQLIVEKPIKYEEPKQQQTTGFDKNALMRHYDSIKNAKKIRNENK